MGSSSPSPTTAERILDAAENAFAERGFAGASLSQIAEAVGIRTPSLYSHFASKRELFEAVITRRMDGYIEAILSYLREPVNLERTESLLLELMSYHAAHPNLARLVQQAALSGEEEFEWLKKRWFDPIYAHLTEYMTDSNLEGDWKGEDLQLLLANFNNIMFSYVTLMPIHRDYLGDDPLCETWIRRQAAFMARLFREIWTRDDT